MADETVLITGASAGIGRELAHYFARDGSDLVLVARRGDALRALADKLSTDHGVNVRVLPKDLSVRGAAREVAAALRSANIRIDVLVNNAGVGAAGRFAEIDAERQAAMVRLNVDSLMELTRLLLPEMLARRRGGVLNVGSTAGFQPGPNMAVYYASKSFVNSFSEALHDEVRGRGVTVTCLAPGPTLTEFIAAADMKESPAFRRVAMSAADAAEAGYRAFRARRALVVPGVLNWVASFMVRFLPRGLVRKVTGRLHA